MDRQTRKYSDLTQRLLTYNVDRWSNSCQFSDVLAAQGFFYKGERDSVQCWQCGVVLTAWKKSDTVASEHFRHSPTCLVAIKHMNLDRTTRKVLTDMIKQIMSLQADVELLKLFNQSLRKNLPVVENEDVVDTLPREAKKREFRTRTSTIVTTVPPAPDPLRRRETLN